MTLASILVVDSDISAREQIADTLRAQGHEVSETENASAALKAVRDSLPDMAPCDYVLLNVRELMASVDPRLRRPAHIPATDVISAGGITIDDVGHRVIVDGEYVSLAPREYRLMLFLLANPDRVFSRKQLLVHVWDQDSQVGARTVDVHIRRLRSVLEPYRYDGYVQTVRGSGYRFSLTS